MTRFHAVSRWLWAVGALAACTDPVAPPLPSTLTVVQGVQEISVPGQRLDTILVRLTDARGNGVPGWRVEWSGDGTVVPVDTVTDALGQASAVWTLPRFPGGQYPEGAGPSGTFRLSVEALAVGSQSLATMARAFIVEAFDADFHYGCGVRAGALWCWGQSSGVFGVQDRDRVPRQVELPGGVTATDVVTSDQTICIRDEDGEPWCTSYGWHGTFRPIDVPPMEELVATDDPFNSRVMIVCGRTRADSTAWCWEVADGQVSRPAQRSARAFGQIVVGRDFGCGLDGHGVAWCWGQNDRGQLGDGTMQSSESPVMVAGNHRFLSITSGTWGVCGSVFGGAVYCWGYEPNVPASPIPRLVQVPGVIGPTIMVDGSGLGYAVVGDALRIWYADRPELMFRHADELNIRRVAGDGQLCVQRVTGEIWCSWILLRGGGDTSPWPSELIPVPDPASIPGP